MYELIYMSLSIYLTVLFYRISLIPKGKNSSESDLALMYDFMDKLFLSP